MPQVNCTVSNCQFWDIGNKCAAEEILVEIDAHARKNLGVEFAGEYGRSGDENTSHKDQAHSSNETCCLTFRPKKAANA